MKDFHTFGGKLKTNLKLIWNNYLTKNKVLSACFLYAVQFLNWSFNALIVFCSVPLCVIKLFHQQMKEEQAEDAE